MTTGPAAVRRLLAKTHPGLDVVKVAGCWYLTGPGTEMLYSCSLNTYRLDGPPARWVAAVVTLLESPDHA